jgi:parallel beta-helix repeat protein
MEKYLTKKGLALTIILLFICMSITPSFAFDNVKKSSMLVSDGNILYVGGNGTGNYTTIQGSINDANSGDTVFVFDDSSPYHENVVVDKSIFLIGEDKNTTIIDSQNHGCVITLLADAVSILNFTIKNAGFHGNDDLAGIFIHSSSNIIFENIITSDTQSAYGMILINSSGNMITSNIIRNNYHAGIEMRYSHNNSITYNAIFNNSHGSMLIAWSSNNFLSNNNISDNICLLMLESSNNTIINNIFNVYGIALIITNSDNNTISQNNFIREWHRIIFFMYNIICGSNKTIKKNYWDGNYWYRQRILPKFIINHMINDNKLVGFRIEVDWHPAKEPYDI